MVTINTSKEIVHEECCKCGIDFWTTKDFNRNLHLTKQSFYCPNGHAQSYSESTEENLKKVIYAKDTRISELEREINKLVSRKAKRQK